MGIKTSQVGSVAAGSSAIQTQLTDAVGPVGGAFWGNPSGKVVLEFTFLTQEEQQLDTGVVLAPTPGVWSMYQWRWDAVESAVNYQLSARIYTGFILFSDTAGDPSARFGTGEGDPGWGSNQLEKFMSFAYNLSQNVLGLRQFPNQAVLVNASGELRLVAVLSIGEVDPPHLGYIKGVFTVSPEVVLPTNPVPPPI